MVLWSWGPGDLVSCPRLSSHSEGQVRAQVAFAPPPAPVAILAPPPQGAAAPAEPVFQFSFSLRKSQRKQLARLAVDAGLTMRAFILEALWERGWR